MSEQVLHDPVPIPDPDSLPQPLGGRILTAILMISLSSVLWGLQPALLLPFGLSLVVTSLIGLAAVPVLQRLKTGQVIREDGPQSHLAKAGTPTMGGIYLVPVGLAVALVWTQADPNVVACSLVTVAYLVVGWLDDWQVIRQQSNQGLSPRQKFGLQVVIAAAFCGWLAWSEVEWSLSLPWLGIIPLSWGFWLLVLFVLVGTNNAVNLTDGMDGLAAGVVGILLVGESLVMAAAHPQLAVFGVCMSGACLGFLWQNRNPAKVFMGDTGSLGLGGSVAAMTLLGNSVWALGLMGLVLIAEALSVILQVSYFKYTKRKTGQGKRLLKMSPLHHHFELSGWPELRVVAVFYGLTAGLATLGWICARY